jgi:hypothetical protein
MPRASTVHAVFAIGIDLGKSTLHMIGLDSCGAIVLREKVSRGRIASRLANLPREAKVRSRGRPTETANIVSVLQPCQLPLIAIFLTCFSAAAERGTEILSTSLSKLASTLSVSASNGSSKLRMNVPYDRSTR